MPTYKSTYIEKDTDIDNVIEIFGRLLHQLNAIMNNMDSQNVKRINTNMTTVKSEDGTTEIDGSQLVMFDGDGHKRAVLGYNKRQREFQFALYKVNQLGQSVPTITLSSDGNAVFSGDINTDSDAHIGNNIYLGNQNSEEDVKRILFFRDGGTSFTDGITAVRDENGTALRIMMSDEIILTVADPRASDLILSHNRLLFDGNEVVTKGTSAYVTINGTDYPVHWN